VTAADPPSNGVCGACLRSIGYRSATAPRARGSRRSYVRDLGGAVGAASDTGPVAYDEHVADRIRDAVHSEQGVTEKRMFGGLAFLINGNMALSASGQGGLLLRVDRAATETLISDPHAERAVMRGRAMDGWLRIEARALVSDRELQRWVNHGVTYARSLPPR